MIWTVAFGKGRVFHTPMGHDVVAMKCLGFASVLERGSEWAATGKVSIPVPAEFPTATAVKSSR
jgi:type 1 glutamine amidotransferase